MRVKITITSPVIDNATGEPLRAEDAIPILIRAYFAPPDSPQRRALCEQAIMCAIFGLANQHKFRARGDRRGRPAGTKARPKIDDSAALAYMEKARATGKSKRERARQAMAAGIVKLNGARPESVVRRLARRGK